jgi:hypothetical protein
MERKAETLVLVVDDDGDGSILTGEIFMMIVISMI